MKSLPSGLCVLLLVALVGCGSGQKTHKVSGTVKMDDEAIKEGRIAFIPEAGGTGGGGDIVNGAYSVNAHPGKNKVQITASRMFKLPAGKKGPMGETEEMRSFIPDKYNSKTELNLEVTGDATKDWDLKSK